MSRPVDQWTAAKLKSALLGEFSELTEDEITAVRQFIAQLGGLENAHAAIDLLQELEMEGESDDLEQFEDFDDLDDLESAA